MILQKVREAERDSIFAEYTGRIGEVITCLVKRMEGGDLVWDCSTSEAFAEAGTVAAGEFCAG